MQCYLFETPSYLFFAPDIPDLLYYSHLPTVLIALLVGFTVFFNNPRALQNRLLLGISITFSFWVLISLFSWTSIEADFLAFIWPGFGASAGLLSILCIYFVYVFLYKRDIGNPVKTIFILLLLPLFLLSYTDLSLSGFNLANCDAFDFEGILYKSYYTALGFLSFVWILAILVRTYRNGSKSEKRQVLYLGAGVELFIFSFIFIIFIVTYLTSLGFFSDSRLELYALFGMTFFMVMLGILIVKFKAFNIATHASQALVIALLILVSSQFTYEQTTTGTILTSITLVLTAMAGLIIVRSVKREIAQRNEIEKLAKKLSKANKRLRELDKMKSEFVSIASHQLRSPLTSIRGYASMLLDGSYGNISPTAKQAIERIADSSATMASSVEDYLNVSRIEAGNMKYELADFNLKDEVGKIVKDKEQEATEKGLQLTCTVDLSRHGVVNADLGKTRQILHNLINNALKYTPEGDVEVSVRDDNNTNKIFVDVKDSGIGMKKDELETIFEKFQRAEGANSVNVTGTGLGLFVAQKMASGMGGQIVANSDGPGKGSTFTLSLPLQN